MLGLFFNAESILQTSSTGFLEIADFPGEAFICLIFKSNIFKERAEVRIQNVQAASFHKGISVKM